MATSDMCIGSYPNLEAQSLSITAAASTTVHVLSAASRYLYNSGGALDLLAQLAATINAHASLSDVTCYIARNRRVQFRSSTAFALVWPVDGVLRDLLGFTGNLVSSVSHSATNISPLLWSANRPVSEWLARLGADGIPVVDTAVGQAGTGVVTSTSHNTYRRNVATWRYVANARVWTTAEAGGEFYVFFREVLAKFRRFKIWRGVTDDTASTTEITFGSPLPSSTTGAYKFAPTAMPIEMQYAREFGLKESHHPIMVPVVSTPEYT